jgi:hypothetical protein
MSPDPNSFVIETREHLMGLLAEAAEIEHHLMCCYLYAAFSLKQDTDENLTEVELAAVRRWRSEITRVAIDEMQHLAWVANLTSAIGGAPHFGRQNFPVPPGYHPAGIVVKLAPFNYETLRHFIYLERPDGVPITDGSGFEPARLYVRGATPGRLMPNSQDYDTVGDLYRAIRAGFERLAGRHGEAALFIGDPLHQLGHDLIDLQGLTRVKCLTTALAALDGIVVQGEGAPGHSATSHFQRFLDIQGEFDRLRAERPDFVPARPAAHNPVMRRPPTPEDRVWINSSPAAELVDLVNASYTTMLHLLMQAYAERRGLSAQRPLVNAAISLMFTISPVASELTRLKANEENPNCTAGMSFATVRGSSALPPGPSTDLVLTERLGEVANTASTVLSSLPRLAGVAEQLRRISADLTEGLASAAKNAPTPGSELLPTRA